MLKQRVISAVLAILLLGVAVYFLPIAELRWIVLSIWTLGAWEWSGFVRGNTLAKRILYTVLLFVPMLIFALDYFTGSFVLWTLLASVVFWLVSFIQILSFPKVFSPLLILVSGIFVVIPSYAAFDYLLKTQDGLLYVFLLLIMIWAADVGAYFSGKRFGKNKLAPKVSPGKTREGALGGLLLSLLIAILGSKYLLGLEWMQSIQHFLILGVAVVFSSIIGDLTVSMFKRNAGVKDSGVFLPGHGGVMDRVDSLCAGVVFFALWLLLFKSTTLVS